MSLVLRLLPDNPVLTKELRVRMRGSRAYWILFGYLGFLSAVLISMYWSFQNSIAATGSGSSEVASLGNNVFTAIVITQVFLVLFITPAITSGSMTIEREQRTLDMLTMTPLPRSSIIAGKLLSAVSFTALLLISSLPLISICFMLGSVDPEMVVSNYMMLLFGSFAIGAMGLMWSSIANTTTQAVMYTYATLFIVTVLGAIAQGAQMVGFTGGNATANAFQAVGVILFQGRFLGIKGPNGIGFALLCALSGLLMAAISRVRLEMWPENKALLLRGLTTLLIALQLLAVNLWWLETWYHRGAQVMMAQIQPPLTVLIITATLLMLLVPIFATGDLLPQEMRRFRAYLASGWKLQGLKRGKLASGLPFLLVLTLVCLLMYAAGFVFLGKTADITHSGGAAQSRVVVTNLAPATPGARSNAVSPTTPTPAPPVGDFPQAALVLLASVTGYGLLCLFLSVALGNRWIAWLIASVLLLFVWIGPTLAGTSLAYGSSPSLTFNLYYLNPAAAVLQLSDPNALTGLDYLLFAPTPLWKVTSLVWLGIGAVSLYLSLSLVSHRSRRANAIPYEEPAANI